MAKNPELQKAAAQRHYEKNKEKIKARAKEYTIKNRQLIREYIYEIKAVPCLDCGEEYPHYVMDFDHRSDKICNIADMISRSVSLEKLKIEIAKCDVVCSNCHRIRTHAG
jgi:hypothetical protein